MQIRRPLAAVLAALAVAPQLGAQSVRGAVTVPGGNPLPGVVVQLLDSTNTMVARALSGDRGEFLVGARQSGTYTLRTLRIGYRPVTSASFVLKSAQEMAHNVELTSIPIALSSVRIDGRSACSRASRDSTSVAFAAWEQVRTAFAATQLSAANRSVVTTTVAYDRVLDGTGKTVTAQDASVRTETVRQPWLERPMDLLRREGYVVDEGQTGTTYYAPGLDALGSNAFLEDHCLRVVKSTDTTRIAIGFEPTPERKATAEVRGTAWMDRATSEVRAIEFKYANVSFEQEQAAGGRMEFARMKNGGWVISRWSIRMPVMEQVTRRAAMGGVQVKVAEIRVTGGELVTVRRGSDSLWTRTPLVLAGVVRDSASGHTIPGARAKLAGTAFTGTTDARGRFAINDVFPGDYTLEIRTPSLDSVGAVHQSSLTFADSGSTLDVRVPNAKQITTMACGTARLGAGRGAVLGRIIMRGDSALPANAKVVAEWNEVGVRTAGRAPTVERTLRWLDGKVETSGSFRLCGVPTNTDLVLRASADGAASQPTAVHIGADNQFSRVELLIDQDAVAAGAFAGTIMDSTDVRIPGAEVLFPELAFAVTSDANGEFRVGDVPAGTQRVIVRKLGFGPVDAKIDVAANHTTARRIVLARVTALAEVTVVGLADKLPREFEEHRVLGLGHFFTRDDLAKQETRRTSDVLAQVPGLGLVRGRGDQGWIMGKRVVPSLNRSSTNPQIYSPSNAERSRGMVAGCYARVYLDRLLMNPGNPAEPFDVNEIGPSRIEAIEFYAGPSQTPLEYAKLNSSCGVLVIHTRKSP